MNKETTEKKGGMLLEGVVHSAKMAGTVIVKISEVKVHPKYQKRYTVTKKYAADTAGATYAAGDKVEIRESRKLSKTKNWVVTRKI